MNKIRSAGAAGAFLLTAVAGGHADAASITYELTCIVGGSLTCGQPSYGAVTFADDPGDARKVDVSINLTGSAERVQEFFFNYNDAKYANSTPFVLTGDVTAYATDENRQKADGYSAGKFDIQAPKHGNIGPEPIAFTIALASTDLNPSDFSFLDTSGKLYDAVHIGNCNFGICDRHQDSIWVGAPQAVASASDPAPAPEPAGVGLLGAGLLGMAVAARRRSRRARA